MKLDLEQLRSVTTGAVRVTWEADGFHFYRFTPEQSTLCQPHVNLYQSKVLSSSGIRLSFRTDSTALYLRANLSTGSGRTFFAFDLMVNGVRTDSLDNFSHLELPDNYAEQRYPLGTYEKRFELGGGEKEVCLFLPWSVTTVLQELALDDGATLTPAIPAKKLLVFGDSITQGYDVLHPCNHYAARLAQALGAEEYNKAIGGAISFPELARLKEPFEPDYVLVAYGTNDWSLSKEDFFVQQYRALHQAIRDNYPAAQVFALAPIWRAELNETREMGSFFNAEKNILAITAEFPNVTAIPCFDFVPKDVSFFGDLRLHPSDAGFEHYFNNLWSKVRAALKE